MLSVQELMNQAWLEITGAEHQLLNEIEALCFERFKKLILQNKMSDDIEKYSAICVEVAIKSASSKPSSYINGCLDCANALRENLADKYTKSSCNLSMIAAMDSRGAIGLKNKLPWYLPEDLKRFKALTMGHHIIMGRKTYESIGILLPGRTTVIVTRNTEYQVKGAFIANTVEEALNYCKNDTEAFIIGGEELFEFGLSLASKLYLTEIDLEVEADAFFPINHMHLWHQQSLEAHTSSNGLSYAYANYIRNNQ